jgi:lactate permease
VITLAKVHGYDVLALSAMIGRQLPFFSLLVPFWLIWAFAGWRGMKEIWPAVLITGVSFARPAVPGLQLHGAGAGRRDRRHLLDGRTGAVPARLAAGQGLDHRLAEKGHETDSGEAQVTTAPNAAPEFPRS